MPEEGPRLGLQQSNEIPETDARLVLLPLVGRELPLVALLRQFLQAGLKFRIGAKLDECPGNVGRERANDGLDEAIKEGFALLHADQYTQRNRAVVE